MRRRVLIGGLLLLGVTCGLSIPWTSHAGRVFFKDLKEVIHQVNVIVVAEVISSEATEPNHPHKRQYNIKVSEVLAGEMDTGEAKVYSNYRVPSTRMGNLYISPIAEHPGSGLESSLQIGKSYIFLFGPESKRTRSGKQIMRVEPLQRRKRVMEVWKQYEESSR